MVAQKRKAPRRSTARTPQEPHDPTKELRVLLALVAQAGIPIINAVLSECAARREHELTILKQDREYALKRVEVLARPTTSATLMEMAERGAAFAAQVQRAHDAGAAAIDPDAAPPSE
jgi:hypothetical protein